MGGHRDALDRASVHDLDRAADRRDRGPHVFPHIPIGRKCPMNAVVSLTSQASPPEDLAAEAAVGSEIAVPAEVPAAVPLGEAVIARAIAEAARSGRSTIDILKETSGRAPAELAHALATALDYRFVGGEELSMLEPAFDILPPSEATRRFCAVVRSSSGLLAIVADPFDSALRSWLETRTIEVLDWAVAAHHY